MVIVVRARKVYLRVLRFVSLVALVFPFNIADARALELFHVAYYKTYTCLPPYTVSRKFFSCAKRKLLRFLAALPLLPRPLFALRL